MKKLTLNENSDFDYSKLTNRNLRTDEYGDLDLDTTRVNVDPVYWSAIKDKERHDKRTKEVYDDLYNRCEGLILEEPSRGNKIIKNMYTSSAKNLEESRRRFKESVDSNHYTLGRLFRPSYRDIEKMTEYRRKGSNPKRLADTVRDTDKALSRLFIAVKTDWPQCANEFKRRCRELGVSQNVINGIIQEAELQKYAEEGFNL